MRALIRSTGTSKVHSRRGIVIVELLLWLPVLLTGLMAVIEFAIMQQVNQQVTLASRYGAKIASEVTRAFAVSPNLSDINQTSTVNNLQSRIDTFLANAGLTASCEVRLEHNACVDNSLQVDTATPCNCTATGPTALPAGEPPGPPGEAYIRVTVCVPLLGNVPNCLSTFGFDITDRIVRHSTTYRVETNNTTPSPVIRLLTLPTGVTYGGALPVLNPPTNSIQLDANGASSDPFNLTFDGNLTTDLETSLPGLTLSWTKTGTPASGPTTATGFVASFDRPNNVGDPDTVHTVQLTVTDPCGATATRTLTITVHRVL